MITLRVNVIRDNGPAIQIPTLVTKDGTIRVVLEYQMKRLLSRSNSWNTKFLQSVMLLLEYAEANPELVSSPIQLFETFSWRLIVGTIDNGVDPSGLGWRGKRPKQAADIVNQLTNFSDWLARNHKGTSLNPEAEPNFYDRICLLSAYHNKNDNAFLGHTDASDAAESFVRQKWRSVELPHLPKVRTKQRPRFQHDRFVDLITKGFVVNPIAEALHHRINLRDVLITLLLNGGGLRESAPFHLYRDDVKPEPRDPTVAAVRIGHPSHGKVRWKDAGKWRTTSRLVYLKAHGLVPRNELRGDTLHAGWKRMVCDGEWYVDVRWSDDSYGRVFLALWDVYMAQVQQLETQIGRLPHPYAFINFSDRNGTIGAPCKLNNFLERHDSAIRRIGLDPKKELGTTPHGHRHDYANRLEIAGITPLTIQICMHHAAIKSQLVYTAAEEKQVNDELNAGMQRLNDGVADSISKALLSL